MWEHNQIQNFYIIKFILNANITFTMSFHFYWKYFKTNKNNKNYIKTVAHID